MILGEEVIAYYGDAGDGAELFEVQKLVRCKDCKHYISDGGALMMCEVHDGLLAYEDDYCSYGERIEE